MFDYNHKRRLVIISITTNEDNTVFTFLLNVSYKTIKNQMRHKHYPNVIMANGAFTITIAIENFSGTTT